MPVVKIAAAITKDRGRRCLSNQQLIAKKVSTSSYSPSSSIPEVLEHIDARHGQIPFAVSGGALDSVTASLLH
jgi:hypothetical protein